MLIIIIFTALGLTVLYYQEKLFRGFVQTIARLTMRLVDVVNETSHDLLSRVFAWIKQETIPRPTAVVVGLVALGLTLLGARVDYEILRKTLSFFFWKSAADLMGTLLVALVALAGLLSHSEGWVRRGIAVLLFLLLLGVHGEVGVKREMAHQQMVWQIHKANDPEGCPELKYDMNALCLAGTMAIAPPCGEACGAWAFIQFGAPAVLFLATGILCLPLTMVAGASYLLFKTLNHQERLVKLGDAMLDILVAGPRMVAEVLSAKGLLLTGLSNWCAAVLTRMHELRTKHFDVGLSFDLYKTASELKGQSANTFMEAEEKHRQSEKDQELKHSAALSKRRRDFEMDEEEKDLVAAADIGEATRKSVRNTYEVGLAETMAVLPNAVRDAVCSSLAQGKLAEKVAALVLLPWSPVSYILARAWNNRHGVDSISSPTNGKVS